MKFRGTKCLNCHQPLDKSDRFCPYCSQENSDKQLSFRDYFREFVGSILVYDSRLRYTIREILFKPGVISKNYISGQRMKYANPFRFFLSVSIIYFLLNGVLLQTNTTDKDVVNFSFDDKDSAFIEDSISNDLTENKEEINTEKTSKPELKETFSDTALQDLSFIEEKTARTKLYLEYHTLYPSESPEEALSFLNHPVNFQNKWFYKRAIAINRIAANPKNIRDIFSSNMPFFLFFFAPVFALFLWMMYSRKYTYMEHLIFLFFIFSFYFLAKIPLLLVHKIFDVTIFDTLFLMVIVPLYFFFALRKFYNQSFWKTTTKFLFLSFVFGISYIISISLYILGIVAVY